jgi:O-antigen/teichoic acid export membrane protein
MTADLRQRTLHSLFWQFLGVGGQRIVQLIAPMVLWRVLDNTADIDLFIVVLSGIGAIEALTVFTGEQSQIWSDRGAERRYLDTIFTVRLLRSLVISSVLCGLAFPLAAFYDKPDYARYWVPGLFIALAWNGLIDAFQSPARASRMKELDFRRVAFGDFLASLLGSAITITLALLWRDVWALVVGYLLSTAARVAMTHWIAPYRPRLHLERHSLQELKRYQKGAAGTPFLLFMTFSAPALVLGKLMESAVAVYDGAARLAKLPEDIFLRVLGPVAIPAYAQLQNDIPRLSRAWVNGVHAFLLAGTPMTVALAWMGDALPELLFGAKYVAVPGLMALLALHGGIAGLTSVIGPLFWAIGKPQWDRQAQLCRCLTMYGLGIPAALTWGVRGFAAATCIAITLALLTSLYHALAHLGVRLSDLTRAARDGLLVGGLLLLLLLTIDWQFAPTAFARLLIAGFTSGPLLGVLLLRLLRRSRPPAVAPVDEPAT